MTPQPTTTANVQFNPATDNGAWVAICVDGKWLLDKHGNWRRFKTREAAVKAAKKAECR